MKKILLLSVMLLCGFAAMAQQPSAYPYSKPYVNDATTGTAQFETACTTSTGAAVVCSAAATNGYVGVCVANCGKTGSAWIAFAGSAPLIVDGTSTIQHYVQLSATAGEGHDSGATTFPTTGADIVGVVLKASTGAASTSMIDVWTPEIQPAGASSTTHAVIWQQLGGTTQVSGQGTFAVNAIKLSAMVVTVPITISNIEYTIGTQDTSGSDNYDIGIYGPCNGGNGSCPLVTHTGNIAGSTFSTGGGAHSAALLSAPVSLASGRYYVAYTCTAGCTATLSGMSVAGMSYITPNTPSTSTQTGTGLPSTIAIPADSWGYNGALQLAFF